MIRGPVSGRTIAIAAAIGAFLAVGGGAFAAVRAYIGPSGTIHGCVAADGSLRILRPGRHCPLRTTSIKWNQRGTRGPRGPSTSGFGQGAYELTSFPVPLSFNDSANPVLWSSHDVTVAGNATIDLQASMTIANTSQIDLRLECKPQVRNNSGAVVPPVDAGPSVIEDIRPGVYQAVSLVGYATVPAGRWAVQVSCAAFGTNTGALYMESGAITGVATGP